MRAERSARVIAPRALERSINLPERPRFNTGTFGDAYWWVRRDPASRGELFVSSGARVCFDTARELGLVTDGDGAPRWTRNMLAALWAWMEGHSVGVPAPLAASASSVPLDWMRAAVWFAYSRGAWPGPGSVQFARELVMPHLDVALASGAGEPTHALSGWHPGAGSPFDAETLADGTGTLGGRTTYEGPEIQVRGRRRSGSAGLVLFGAFAVGAVIAGGD